MRVETEVDMDVSVVVEMDTEVSVIVTYCVDTLVWVEILV